MICGDCYSENIGVGSVPAGCWVRTIDICEDCNSDYILTDKIDIRFFKIDKIINNVLRSSR